MRYVLLMIVCCGCSQSADSLDFFPVEPLDPSVLARQSIEVEVLKKGDPDGQCEIVQERIKSLQDHSLKWDDSNETNEDLRKVRMQLEALKRGQHAIDHPSDIDFRIHHLQRLLNERADNNPSGSDSM